jgi:hypothetical protein
MPRHYGLQEELIISDAVATVANSAKIDVKDYMHVNLCVIGTDTASFTLKVKGSDQEDVDFSAAASKINRWAYVECINLADRTDIRKGSVGIVIAANSVGLYEINANGLAKVTIEVSSWTSGKASVYSRKYNNY